MTVTLHLGVIEQPYTSYDGGRRAAKPGRRGKKAVEAPAKAQRTVTTAQVARWLEDRYHVMEVFYESDGGVLPLLRESMEDAMEDVLMGSPVGANPFLAATSEIQKRFKQFISNRTMETMGYPGVPTKAALMGISSRFKAHKSGIGLVRRKGSVAGVRRPSFRDTGLYQASFMAWVD